MTATGFLFDANRCTGCQACEIGCAIENELPWGTSWRQVSTFNRNHRRAAPSFHLSLACNHCADAPCMRHCPALAISSDPSTSAVLIDARKCIGCGYCSWACPYDAPVYDEAAGIMTKCTFCDHRLAEGLDPACVTACPTGCLEYGDLGAGDLQSTLAGFPQHDVGPLIRFTPLSADRLRAPAAVEELERDARPLPPPERERRRPVGLRSEWPLAVFTLIFAGLVAAHARALVDGGEPAPAIFVGAALLATVLSGLHLGRISRAWRAVLNLRRSWLSREIAAWGGFLALVACWHLGPPQVAKATGMTALAVGLFGLYAVDRVYDLALRRGRHSVHSADTFWTGGLLISMLLHENVLAVAILAFKLFLHLRQTQLRDPSGLAAGRPFSARWWRPVLSIVGMAGWIGGSGATQALGFVLIGLVEVADRCLFYEDLRFDSPARRMEIDLISPAHPDPRSRPILG